MGEVVPLSVPVRFLVTAEQGCVDIFLYQGDKFLGGVRMLPEQADALTLVIERALKIARMPLPGPLQ
jgi:hypothetical protein